MYITAMNKYLGVPSNCSPASKVILSHPQMFSPLQLGHLNLRLTDVCDRNKIAKLYLQCGGDFKTCCSLLGAVGDFRIELEHRSCNSCLAT